MRELPPKQKKGRCKILVVLCKNNTGKDFAGIIDGRENRGQLQLSVGLKVIGRVRDNSPLPARYQNKYGSQKPRPRLVHASAARGIIEKI